MDKDQNIYRHILKYTGVFGSVQGLSLLVSLVRNKFVAVFLGLEGMGLVGLYNATVKLMTDSTGFGLSTSAVRSVSQAFDSADSCRMRHAVAVLRTWAVLASVLGYVLTVALSPWLSRFTFSSADYTLQFIILAPAVGLATLVSCEMAVLKAMRQLSSLATITIFNVLGALAVSVPVYWIWGIDGIVASLLTVAVLQFVFTLHFSARACPWRFRASWRLFRRLLSEGCPMVRLGMAFLLASLCGSAADWFVRITLNAFGSTTDVGLFNAGYMMTMTYGSMMFSSMETDYFPRLSACADRTDEMNIIVCRQMEVSLLLISPMMVAFSLLLPLLLPLLFTAQFVPAIPMMQVVIIALYLRAVKLPVAYLPLAKGDSRAFLFLEALYAVVMVVLVLVGYRWKGLVGTGYALLLISVMDLVVQALFSHYRYGFTWGRSVARYLAFELLMAAAVYGCTLIQGWLRWVLGSVLLTVSLSFSLRVLHDKTNIYSDQLRRFKRK